MSRVGNGTNCFVTLLFICEKIEGEKGGGEVMVFAMVLVMVPVTLFVMLPLM
jgi:hypothetical protein